MEANQESIICPRSPNWYVVELGFEPKQRSPMALPTLLYHFYLI